MTYARGGWSVRTSQATLMDKDWCALTWGPWVPLDRQPIMGTGPAVPGVYRIPAPRWCWKSPRLYRADRLDATGAPTRVAAGASAEQCPFNDPHTAAPHLWLLHQHDHVQLECSCAPVVGNVPVPPGTEDMLLWRHRMEAGRRTAGSSRVGAPVSARLAGRRLLLLKARRRFARPSEVTGADMPSSRSRERDITARPCRRISRCSAMPLGTRSRGTRQWHGWIGTGACRSALRSPI